jgi:thiamine-phosphate pyrophosphorylase
MKILFILDHETFKDEYINVAATAAPYADMIWYRIKGLADGYIFQQAKKLRNALPDATLILSERADIACAAGFQGVHLNAKTLPVEIVTKKFPRLITGFSAHSPAQCNIEADYITLSPIFHTNKPYDVEPLGVIPAPAKNVFALGGINSQNIPMLADKGYAGVAGISFYNELNKIKIHNCIN